MNIPDERRAQAFREASTWPQFLDSMKVNRAAIEANYTGYRLDEAAKARLARLPGVTDVLVLAHDWCGDVVANLPLFAKIEAETGKIRLHILPKDPDNADLGLLYPHSDGDVHIPIYLFFDGEGREKGHFIERTEEMTGLLGTWMVDFWKARPGLEGQGKPFSALDPDLRSSLLSHLAAERRKVRDRERDGIIAMMEGLLTARA